MTNVYLTILFSVTQRKKIVSLRVLHCYPIKASRQAKESKLGDWTLKKSSADAQWLVNWKEDKFKLADVLLSSFFFQYVTTLIDITRLTEKYKF